MALGRALLLRRHALETDKTALESSWYGPATTVSAAATRESRRRRCFMQAAEHRVLLNRSCGGGLLLLTSRGRLSARVAVRVLLGSASEDRREGGRSKSSACTA
jgi:hypothetical protein